MTASPIASRIFDLDDQREFARLSSDWNPMHLDPAFARRTQVGAPVVHGIHNLAWAANAVLQAHPIKVVNIRARFLQPLYLHEEVSVILRNQTEGLIGLDVNAAGNRIATVRLSSTPGKVSTDLAEPESIPHLLSQPASPVFEDLAKQRGAVAVAEADFRSLYPALTGAIGASGVKALLASSQVIGMACPGLHSLFSDLDINFGADAGNALAYRVDKVDKRFRSLHIAIAGYGVRGRLEAFARPAPPVQAGMSEITARVKGDPFAGQRSLVVGGSRGLGEVTARIIAAGGGWPVITYLNGKHEAEAAAADITGFGGQCDVMRFDALAPAHEQLRGLKIDCCYYFATPKIFQRKPALYDPETMRLFLRFYTDGLFDICAELGSDASTRTVVFYPSTTAIDEGVGNIAEYAMAKAAGEVLADYITKFSPGVQVICRRLPRILTDQTATVGVATADNALDTMLPLVYEVQQAARSMPVVPR
jgi:NAD(P)-dependent dehydrogenase (short-subunit alcohol dehydrogenase family)